MTPIQQALSGVSAGPLLPCMWNNYLLWLWIDHIKRNMLDLLSSEKEVEKILLVMSP